MKKQTDKITKSKEKNTVKEKNILNGEQDFLNNYSIEDYDRPSLAVDMVIFSIYEETVQSQRRVADGRLSILLIRRSDHPYKDCWALPGGFLRKDETIEECGLRELCEETGLKKAKLIPVGSFSNPGRDPRGWIISNAFMSPVFREHTSITGGSDAAEAVWFTIDFSHDEKSRTYKIKLTSKERDSEQILTAKLSEKEGLCGMPEYKVKEASGIAFDHPVIILRAILELRRHLESDGLAYDFLDERFTFNQLQKVHELILGQPLLTANFRRKTASEIEETGEILEGKAFRPAMLYRKKKQS